MQRLALQSGHFLLRSACVRSSSSPLNSQFCPSLRTLNTSFKLSATPVTPSKQVPDTPPPSFAGYFKLERQVFVASLPLIPLAYFVHGPVIDAILTVAIVANCHFGAHAVLTDYARPIVVGEKVAKLAHYAAYLSTVLLLAGLLHFNYNDVGITRAFELVFGL